MLTINDNRKINTARLSSINFGDFFFYDGVLYQRGSIDMSLVGCDTRHNKDLIVWNVCEGTVTALNRDITVEPINNINIEIDD